MNHELFPIFAPLTEHTMAEKKQTTIAFKEHLDKKATSLFGRENLKWMLGGAVVIALGFILMAGGKSNDPTVFNDKEVYSTIRITVAPVLILIGLVIEIIAIFKKPKG